jgi:hypothetical protein
VSTTAVRAYIEDRCSPDPARQNRAFQALLKATDHPVPWVYDVWDDLLRTLVDGDNRQRSIAAQVLSNLAKSDSTHRMMKDIRALMKVTKDERFVTARHCLQSLWKVGIAGELQRAVLVKELKRRFKECRVETNCTLIRYDILVVLKRVYDVSKDETIWSAAKRLMTLEEDAKYATKYATRLATSARERERSRRLLAKISCPGPGASPRRRAQARRIANGLSARTPPPCWLALGWSFTDRFNAAGVSWNRQKEIGYRGDGRTGQISQNLAHFGRSAAEYSPSI